MQATMRKRRQSLRNNPHAEAAESAAAEAAGAIVEQSATQNLLNFVNKIKKENAEEASSSAVQPVVQEIKQEPPESEEMTVEEKLRRPGLICYLCVEPFETKDVLAMHMSRAHRSKNIEEAAALYCPIELCNVVVFSQPQLVVHARSHHSKSSDSKEQKFMSYSRSFDDQDKFKKWRNRSLKSVSTMTCDTSNETENYLETVFHCRPTFAKPNAACPAFSNIRLFKSGKIKITYCFDHLGHVIAPTDSASSNSPDVTTCEDALEVHPDELLGESPSDSTVGDVLRKRLREGVPLDTPPVAAAIAPTNNSVNVVVPEPVVPNRPITNSILPAGFVIRHGLYDDVLEVDEKKFTYRDFYDIIWDFFCFIKTQNETVTCERLKLSAVEIAKRMGLSSFTGNDWWLRSFKRRHKLKFSTMTGEPYNYDNVKEVVLKCEAEDKTVEEVMKMEAEAERQAQKRSVATETSPMGSPFHNFNEFPSDHFHNGGQGSAMEILQALAHSCIIPQKRDDADVSWAFEVIRSQVIQRNISLLPQLTSLQSALAVAPTPPPAAPNPQVVTVLQSVPVTTTAAAAVDLHGSSNLLLVSQPPAPAELLTNTHAGLKMAVGHNGVDEKDVAVPRPKKRKISGK